jgi:hypothetical protein
VTSSCRPITAGSICSRTLYTRTPHHAHTRAPHSAPHRGLESIHKARTRGGGMPYPSPYPCRPSCVRTVRVYLTHRPPQSAERRAAVGVCSPPRAGVCSASLSLRVCVYSTPPPHLLHASSTPSPHLLRTSSTPPPPQDGGGDGHVTFDELTTCVRRELGKGLKVMPHMELKKLWCASASSQPHSASARRARTPRPHVWVHRLRAQAACTCASLILR